MSNLHLPEEKFEDHIESHLNAVGYGSTHFNDYDRNLCLIRDQVNNVHGVNLTDEDKIDLSRLKRRLMDNPEIEKYMTGENTDDNKQNYFKEQFEGLIVDYVNERFEFYKKMEDNPPVKNMIFQKMYSDYQKSQRPSESK